MALSNTDWIPTDILYAVLEHLTDRRDLYAAALANRDFNRAVTPLLYRTLDTDTRAGRWAHTSSKSVRSFQLFTRGIVLNLMPDQRCNPPCVYPSSKA
jgi:hypothetical protein